MKILLVKPESYSHQVVPPLGLGYLATALLRAGHDVAIVDCVRERLTVDELARRLRARGPSLLGVQTFSFDVERVQRLARLAKEALPHATVVLGGPHPSGAPVETLAECPAADFAFAGEAEVGLPALVAALPRPTPAALAAVPGLVWRDGGDVRVNRAHFVEDLDSLGFPSWELMPPAGYPPAVSGFFYRRSPVAPLVVTRGCPCACSFCGGRRVNGARVRRRSPANVIEELTLLRDRYGVREFQILDDNFTGDRDHALEVCRRMVAAGLDLPWCLPNGIRLDTLDAELAAALRRAGCYEVAVGIESGSQAVLDDMQKGLTLAQIRRGVGLLRDAGVDVNGFFIVGYPWSTRADHRATIDFAVELDLLRANFTNFLPLPGTPATRRLQREGRLDRIPWSKLFYAKAVTTPPDMTLAELKRWQRRAFLRFYLRPRQLWRLVSDVRSFAHARILVRRSLDFLFMR